MDEIRVGDIVEYCFGELNPTFREYDGILGTVLKVLPRKPYKGLTGYNYETEYLIDWNGTELEKEQTEVRLFWNFTIRKVKSKSYDPTQCGDTDEDI